MILKVGLLLDSMRVPMWQLHIVTFIKSNPSFSLELIVLNNSPTQNSLGTTLYRFFRRLDRWLFKAKNDCFERIVLDDSLSGIDVMQATPARGRFTDKLADGDVEVIKSKNLDVLVRFGFRILKGEILQAARLGVWSLHHGDNAVNRGGPPAFWEVALGEDVSGVTLQVLSADLDAGVVIDKAFVRTDRTSFYRNQNAVYWAGIEVFCDALRRAANGHRLPTTELPRGLGVDESIPEKHKLTASPFYYYPLYRNPGNGVTLGIFLSFWVRRVKEVVQSGINKPRWSLFYSVKKGSPQTSLFRFKKLASPPGTDWADPFIVCKEKRYIVFFEELIHRQKQGHICAIEFSEAGELVAAKPTIVLEEDYHLSYPFVFEHADHWYMLPEAADSNNVWLYRCENFPGQWKKFRLLLANTNLYDPTLVLLDGTWYLFGTQKPMKGNSPDQYLYIYYSDDLFSGAWQPHPQNPVTRDVRGARPAGKIFKRDGKLIRPGQIGAPKYGYGIRFYEIIMLTREEYAESAMDDILPHWQEGLLATHTFNQVNGFSIVDAQHYS